MNLLNIKEVIKQTKLNQDEIRDLIQKDLFPKPFGEVQKDIYWSQDEVERWLNMSDINAVSKRTGLSKSVIKRLGSQGAFPTQWDDETIDRWLRSRKAQLIIKANK